MTKKILLPKIVKEYHTVEMSKYDYSQVETFKGNLDAVQTRNFLVPKLTKVGGFLWASGTNNLLVPKLTTVKGDLCAGQSTNFQAPRLTTIGGDIYPGGYPGTKTLQEINEAPLAELPLLLTKYKDNSFLVGRIKQRLQA